MKRPIRICALAFFAALLGLAASASVMAEEIRVAVASNFTNAIRDIAGRFEQQSGHRVTLVFGSTGKHYAQIKHGAPFEVFFAADVRRPKLLDEEGVALAGSRFTYAFGKLVLWSPDADRVDPAGVDVDPADQVDADPADLAGADPVDPVDVDVDPADVDAPDRIRPRTCART